MRRNPFTASGGRYVPPAGRGFYSMIGDGASKAVQGMYRGAGTGVKEAAGAARNATDKVKETAKNMKESAETVRPREQLAEAYDNTVNYMLGKPTATELAEQFKIALTNNQAAEIALRLLPATAAVGSVIGLGNIAFGGDTFANKGMDLLGMGTGIYGLHQFGGVGGTTPAGRALRYTGGATLGKIGSDLIQLAAGGGQSQTDQRLAEALIALQGGRG